MNEKIFDEDNRSSIYSINRELMTDMLNANIESLRIKSSRLKNQNTSSSPSVFNVHWINGHPERREQDKSIWNLYDMGIYLADEAARFPNMFTRAPESSPCQVGRFQMSSVQHVECSFSDIIRYNKEWMNSRN